MEKRKNRRYTPIRIIDASTGDEEITTIAWQDMLDEAQYGQAELMRSAREELLKSPKYMGWLNVWKNKKDHREHDDRVDNV